MAKIDPFPQVPHRTLPNHSRTHRKSIGHLRRTEDSFLPRMHDRTLYDYPTVSIPEAAQLHMMDRERFRKRFKECLHKEIRSVKLVRSVRLLLVDVLRSAYPEAPEEVIYQLAYRYTRDRHRRRSELLMNAKRKREGRNRNA